MNGLQRLWIGSLDSTVTTEELRSLFKSHGVRTSEIHVYLKKARRAGRAFGFAFAYVADDEVENAIRLLDGQLLHGNALSVQVGNVQRAHRGGQAGRARIARERYNGSQVSQQVG